MENAISYETFRKFQRLEHDNDALQQLPDDFYRSCSDWMRRKEKLYDETKDPSVIREIDNVMQIMKDIMDRREKKILLLATHSTRSNIIPKNLLKDELECFNSVSSSLKTLRERVLKSLSSSNLLESDSKPTETEKKEFKIREGYSLVRMMDVIEKFVGTDELVYGPLKTGDVVSLPDEISKMLVSKEKAEFLSQKI